jgi:hypothetical protein
MAASAKTKVKGVVHVNSYRVLEECVEVGVACGLRRADKHVNTPITAEQFARFQEHVEREVMQAISEKFHFPIFYE